MGKTTKKSEQKPKPADELKVEELEERIAPQAFYPKPRP
jgi:hypothetical protein